MMALSRGSFTFVRFGISFTLACLCLGGCVADLAGENDNTGSGGPGGDGGGNIKPQPIENPPTILETLVVPENPAPLIGEERCVDLGIGERLLGVDPNGIAWLATDAGASTDLRTFDPRELAPGEEFSMDLGGIVDAQILGAHDASFLTPDALLSFTDGTLQTHALTFDGASNLCGDPFSNGAVLAAGRFMERRGSEWWAWEPAVAAEASLVRLFDVAGECYDQNDSAWMLGADDRLWRVSHADTQLLFSDVLSIDVTPKSTGVLTADSFYYGRNDWQRWTFSGVAPDRVFAGGDVMWLQSEQELLRFDGTEFLTLNRPAGAALDAAFGHAGGLWIEGEGRVCHYTTQESLRVQGIRPGERAEQEAWSVEVELSDSAAALQAWLNGDALNLTAPAAAGMQRVEVPSARLGWNEVRLVQGTAERTVFFKRVPSVVRSWATDIAPLSAEACLSCHAPGGDAEKFPLENYEQWLVSAADIRIRVIETETMPPIPAPGWENEMRIIAEWLEGGTNP